MHLFFGHAAATLAIGRTQDPARLSGPIKLEATKDTTVMRLSGAREHFATALAADDTPDVVASELPQVFWDYLPESLALSSKASTADLLRCGTPRFRGTISGLVVPLTDVGDAVGVHQGEDLRM